MLNEYLPFKLTLSFSQISKRIRRLVPLFAVAIWFTPSSGFTQSISDGGFEQVRGYTYVTGPGSIGPWTINQGSAAVVNGGYGVAHSGTQVLVVALISSPSTTTVSQDISGLIPGDWYRVSFFTSVYRISPFSGEVINNVKLGSGSLEFTYSMDSESSRFGVEPNTPWVERSFDFLASESTLPLEITASHLGYGGFVGFDDFSLQQIPEPTTFGLMGIGCVVSYCYHRKNRRNRPTLIN
jgi:hypothetical protein